MLGPTTYFGRTGRRMDIKALTDRAMEIRGRYAELEKARSGREWTREELMQGFVVDVGDLMKLVMAKNGSRHVADVDRKLAHELSDCLWCVLVLHRLYGLDPQTEFLKTMDELEASISRKMKAP